VNSPISSVWKMGGYGVKELLRTSLIDLWKVADNHGSDTCR
jgi:hypothetical protein